MGLDAGGILSGAGGQAIAQMLAQGALDNQKQSNQQTDWPSLIQAMAYGKNQDASALATLEKAKRDQTTFDQSQTALANLEGQGGTVGQAVQYQRAGLDSGVQSKMIENLLTQDTSKRKAEGQSLFMSELQHAVDNEGLSPQEAVPMVLFRLNQDKESAAKLADAFGTDPKTIQELSDFAQELLVNKQEGQALPIMENAMQLMTQDVGTNFEALMRNPVLFGRAVQNYVSQAALQFSKDNPPPDGMSMAEWVQHNTKIGINSFNTVINPSTGKKQNVGANPLERMRVLANIADLSYKPWATGQELDLKAEDNQIARDSNAIRLGLGTEQNKIDWARLAAERDKPNANKDWDVDEYPGLKDFDTDGDGVIPYGSAERRAANAFIDNSIKGQTAGDTETTTSVGTPQIGPGGSTQSTKTSTRASKSVGTPTSSPKSKPRLTPEQARVIAKRRGLIK